MERAHITIRCHFGSSLASLRHQAGLIVPDGRDASWLVCCGCHGRATGWIGSWRHSKLHGRRIGWRNVLSRRHRLRHPHRLRSASLQAAAILATRSLDTRARSRQPVLLATRSSDTRARLRQPILANRAVLPSWSLRRRIGSRRCACGC